MDRMCFAVNASHVMLWFWLSTASGGWPELENENDKRVSCIQTICLSCVKM